MINTNVAAGYTENAGIQCDFGSGTVTNALVCSDFTITQQLQQDCSTKTGIKVFADPNQAYSATATTVPSTNTWASFFTNSDTTNCPVVSCILRASGCGSAYTSGQLSIGTGPSWSLTMNTNLLAGYTENAGIECDYGSDTITNALVCSDITITQRPHIDCSAKITAISFIDPNQAYSATSQVQVASWTSFFRNFDLTNCPLISCTLKAQGCGSMYTAGELSLGTASPWSLTMNTNMAAGYLEDAGIECNFGSGSVTNVLVCSDFTITQQQQLDCAAQITAISFPDPNQAYSASAPATTVPSTNTWASFFTNPDSTNCPLVLCTLKAQGCGSAYTAGELSLGTASPWSLTMNTNVAPGYTENAGIECDFGSETVTNALVCSDITITQQKLNEDPASQKEAVGNDTEGDLEIKNEAGTVQLASNQTQTEDSGQSADLLVPLTVTQVIEELQKKEDAIKTIQKEKQLKIQGFKKLKGIEYSTFPGIDPAQVDRLRAQLKKEKEKDKLEEVFTPDISVEIDSVSQNGTLTLKFNQQMLVPTKIDQKLFEKIMKVGIRPDLDPHNVLYGTFVEQASQNTEKKRSLETLEQDLSFNVTVLSFEPKLLKIQIGFNLPGKISQSKQRDKACVIFIEPSTLVSAETGKSMKMNQFKQDEIEIRHYIPTQVSQQVLQQITTLAKTGQFSVLGIGSGNLAVSVLFQGSIQQLFGLLRGIQMIVFSSLMDVPMQPQAGYFLRITFDLIQLDLIDSQSYYQTVLEFEQTPPVNEKFDEMDIETMTFMLNSGSYLFFVAIALAAFSLKNSINKLATRFASYEKVRNFCILFGTHKTTLKRDMLKLFLEMYFELAIAVCIQVNLFFFEWKHGQSVDRFFSSWAEKFNLTLALIVLVALFWFPISGYMKISQAYDQKSINKAQVKKELSHFLEDLRTSSKPRAAFNVIFLCRRLTTSIILVITQSQPFFAFLLLIWLSLAKLSYLLVSRPKLHLTQNLLDLFNEGSIYLVLIFLGNLLNIAFPDYIKNGFSWMLVYIIAANIFFNLAFILQTNCVIFFEHRLKKKAKQAVLKALVECKETRKILCDRYPLKFEGFREFDRLQEALEFCENWREHRKWLIASKVKFQDFEEEKKFQQYYEEFQLTEMFKIQRMKNLISYEVAEAAKKDAREKKAKLISIRMEMEEQARRNTDDKQQVPVKQVVQVKAKAKSRLRRNENKLGTIKEDDESNQITPSKENQLEIARLNRHIDSLNPENQMDINKKAMLQTQLFKQQNTLGNLVSNLLKDMAQLDRHKTEIVGSGQDQIKIETRIDQILQNPQKVQLNFNNLDFEFSSEDDDDYHGHFSVRGLKVFQEFQGSDGICHFEKGELGPQIVRTLQCLMRCRPFADLVLTKVPEKTLEDESLLKNLKSCYKAGFEEVIGQLTTKKVLHQQWEPYFSRFYKKGNTPIEFMTNIMAHLMKELVQDQERKYWLREIFGLATIKEKKSKCRHKNYKTTSASILKLKKCDSVLKSIHEHFKIQKSQEVCEECGAQFLTEEKQVRAFPEVLVLGFEKRYNWEMLIQEKINLRHYLSETALVQDKNQLNPKYILQAMICRLPGKELKTAIRKHDGGWINLEQDNICEGIDFEEVYNPHLLFYLQTHGPVENHLTPEMLDDSSSSSEDQTSSSDEETQVKSILEIGIQKVVKKKSKSKPKKKKVKKQRQEEPTSPRHGGEQLGEIRQVELKPKKTKGAKKKKSKSKGAHPRGKRDPSPIPEPEKPGVHILDSIFDDPSQTMPERQYMSLERIEQRIHSGAGLSIFEWQEIIEAEKYHEKQMVAQKQKERRR